MYAEHSINKKHDPRAHQQFGQRWYYESAVLHYYEAKVSARRSSWVVHLKFPKLGKVTLIEARNLLTEIYEEFFEAIAVENSLRHGERAVEKIRVIPLCGEAHAGPHRDKMTRLTDSLGRRCIEHWQTLVKTRGRLS